MMKSTLQENLTKYQRVMEYMLVMVLLNAEMTLLRHQSSHRNIRKQSGGKG